jgi:hypothetical protein
MIPEETKPSGEHINPVKVRVTFLPHSIEFIHDGRKIDYQEAVEIAGKEGALIVPNTAGQALQVLNFFVSHPNMTIVRREIPPSRGIQPEGFGGAQ